MKVVFTMVMIVAALAVMNQCNPASEKEVDVGSWSRNLDDEKSDVIKELVKLNDVVDEQLDNISSKVSTTNDDTREAIANTEKRLLAEQKEIKEAMHRVQQSSENKWDDVKEDISGKLTDIRIEISRVREKIKNEVDIN